MSVPQWWLVLSGVTFALFIVLTIVLVVLAVQLIGLVKELSVRVKALSARADAISKRVELLVDEVTTQSKLVGSRAHSIATTADAITHGMAKRLEVLSAALFAFGLIKNVFKAIRRR